MENPYCSKSFQEEMAHEIGEATFNAELAGFSGGAVAFADVLLGLEKVSGLRMAGLQGIAEASTRLATTMATMDDPNAGVSAVWAQQVEMAKNEVPGFEGLRDHLCNEHPHLIWG